MAEKIEASAMPNAAAAAERKVAPDTQFSPRHPPRHIKPSCLEESGIL